MIVYPVRIMESITGKYTIKQIFKEHWDDYLKKYPLVPEYIRNEVRKVLGCRDPKNGYLKYVCPKHSEATQVIPFSCKSRFCNVCGVAQTNKWTESVTNDFPNTAYVHIVFTVPDYLWYFFHNEQHRELLNCLFKASARTVLGWFKTRGLTPGITSVLHTFGKKINYNTHIHMIVTAAGLSQDKSGEFVWKKQDFLPYDVLKKRWRAILLNLLEPHIDSSFRKMLFKIGWYVNIGIRLSNPEVTCKYIGRYAKRPVIAETRITNYDGSFISFYYEDKSEGYKKREYCAFDWEEFITRLIQHIPRPQFKMIRHYGILANAVKNKLQPIVFKLLNQTKIIASWLRWRARQIKHKRVDPLLCKICGQEMVLKELAFYSKIANGLWVKTF